MRPYPVDKKCLAICAPCGTGKTVQLLKYIAEWRRLNPQGSVVCSSMRITQSAEFLARSRDLGFESYRAVRDLIDLREHPMIVVQYESMDRIAWLSFWGDGGKILFVIDEFVGVLRHMEQETRPV